MRPWLISVAALGLALALAPLARPRAQVETKAAAPAILLAQDKGVVSPIAEPPSATPAPAAPHLAGLDLLHVAVDDSGASAEAADGSLVKLTLDPSLQAAARAILAAYNLPEAAIVAMDVETGAILAYASHVDHGTPRDLVVEATAPAASVFKIVTASALVESAGLSPDTRQCYSGGEQRLLSSDLVDDPLRDKWCVTLAGAMGRSINAVFAKLAQKDLTPAKLEETARAFGFGASLPFDVPVAPSMIKVPEEKLAFARTAAGFWNSTLSPLHAAWLSATVARGGEAIRPFIVKGAHAGATRQVVTHETADALTTMLEHTVSEGTSFHAFHDAKGTAFLPNVRVAGKTGTLTDDKEHRFYTWFTGFAPSRPTPGVRSIAVAALVVNGPSWRVKANVVARQLLQAHFAEEGAAGVAYPKLEAVANREP